MGPLAKVRLIPMVESSHGIGAGAPSVSLMGGTPGKLLLGMQVVDATGGVAPPPDPIGWKRAANQLLAGIPVINVIAGAIIGIVSLVFLFSDDQQRTVMDRFGGTLVVDKQP